MSQQDAYIDLTDRFARQLKSIGIGGGILTLVVGVLIMVWPSPSLQVLMVLIGISAIVGGIYRLADALTGATTHPWLLGFASLILIFGGAVIVRNPTESTGVFGIIIGAVWLTTGIAQLFAALFSGAFPHRGWMIIGGIISAIAGIVVLGSPGVSVAILAWITGIYLVIMGIVLIIESWMIDS